jgi:hypothetical protein
MRKNTLWGKTADFTFPCYFVIYGKLLFPSILFKAPNIEAEPASLKNLRPMKSFNIPFVSIRWKIKCWYMIRKI